MFALCLRYTQTREEAEDVLQEGFLKVYRDLHQYKPEAPLGAWIRKVMVNTALENIRKKKRRPQARDEEIAPWENYTETDASEAMQAQDLMKLISGLPEEYKLVFNLVAIEGFSHREVAEMLRISESNSKVRLTRARAILREKVAALFEIER